MIFIDIWASQYFFEIGNLLPNFIIYFLATYLIWFCVFFVILISLKTKDKIKVLVYKILKPFIASLFSLGVNNIISWIYFRPRPFVEFGFDSIVEMSPFNASMPSGHSAVSWAIASTVFYKDKKNGIVLFIAAFFISIGRVLAGVHYLSDIIAGAIVGIFSGIIISWYLEKNQKSIWDRLFRF